MAEDDTPALSWLDASWMQQGIDALRETLGVDARLKRDMVQFLLDEGFWDASKAWDSSMGRFNNCMNPDRPEFFKLSELWALMKRFGRHQLFHVMARDLGYEVRPLATEARRQELLRRVAAAYELAGMTREAVVAELERLDSAGPELVIEPGIRAGGRFSMGGGF